VDRNQPAIKEPIFNIPRPVVFVLAVLIAMHGLQQILDDRTVAWMVLSLAFIPARYSGLAGDLPGGWLAVITSWLTHMFVHADLAHLGFNSASLLAFGGAVAKRVGGVRFLVFSLACGVAGALAFLLANPGLEAPMIGASGAISGLMGGATLLLCSALDQGGVQQLREAPGSIALMPLHIAVRDKRILLASAVFLFLNSLASFGLGGVESAGDIAWETHIGGYIAGLGLFGLFDVAVRNQNDHQPTLH
jgi:membrane associated rhomboid family serine protease